MSNLLEKASILTTPTAYNDGKLLSVKGGTPADFDFTRGSTATRVNSSGLIEAVASGLPRIDYNDGVGSVLLEPQSTNLVTYSEDFTSNSNYSTNAPSGIFESGYLAPDGTNTATRINGFDGYYLLLSNLGSADTRSMYVKSGNGQTGNVNLLDRNNHTGSLFEVTSEWKRIELVGVDSAFYIVDGRGANITLDDIIIWGLQQENLSLPTSYIPTNGSIITRLAETLNNSGSSDLINSTEGVLYAELSRLDGDTSGYKELSISDGTTSNSIKITLPNSSAIQGRVRTNISGTIVETLISHSPIGGYQGFQKIALKYKQNDFSLFVNGTKVGFNTNGNTCSTGVINNFSFNRGNPVNIFYGSTKCVAVFKEALTDDELTCLTTI